MSAFFPSVEICLTNGPMLHGKDVLKLKRGQWCHCRETKGRLLNPDTLEVLWRFAHESFKDFNLRFSAAITRKKKLRARGFKREQFDLFSLLLDKKYQQVKTQVNTCSHDFGPVVMVSPSLLIFCRKCGAELQGRTVNDLQPCTDEDFAFLDSLKSFEGEMIYQLSSTYIAQAQVTP